MRARRICLLTALTFAAVCCTPAGGPAPVAPPPPAGWSGPGPVPPPRRMRLFFGGDVMQHMPQVDAVRRGDGFDYEPVFRTLAPRIRAADLAVVNLETTLTRRSRYTGYPLFRSPAALADALPLPLYLYNMPSHVKVFLEPATVKTLANHPNIVGLKDSSANMTYFQTLLYHLGDNPDFSLYVGPEELTGECVLLGADGGVNGGANIFPELYVAMYDAACAHDITRVREIQRRIMQISTSVYTVGKYGSSYLKGVKCALSLLGVCDDYLSYPYRKFRTEERARIRQALEALGANCNV